MTTYTPEQLELAARSWAVSSGLDIPGRDFSAVSAMLRQAARQARVLAQIEDIVAYHAGDLAAQAVASDIQSRLLAESEKEQG